MIRLLHLHEHQADFQTRRPVEQLQRGLGQEFDLHAQTIGGGSDLGHVIRAAFALRRQTRSYDLVHAWGMRALTAVAMAGFPRIIFSPTDALKRRQIGWLRAIMSYRDVQIVTPTITQQRPLHSRGVPVHRCHLVRPGVDFSRLKPKGNAPLRAQLGFTPDQQVLIAAGESTRSANHRQAVWTAAILNVNDRNTRLLLWGRGPMARSAAEFAAKLAQPELVVLAEEKLAHPVDFEEMLSVADTILVSATAPVSTLPIAIAMASGVPIAATVTPTVSELLEDRHTALMTQPLVPRLLAQRVTQLRSDERLRWSLADQARTEAYNYFSQTRFIEEMAAVYQRSVGAR